MFFTKHLRERPSPRDHLQHPHLDASPHKGGCAPPHGRGLDRGGPIGPIGFPEITPELAREIRISGCPWTCIPPTEKTYNQRFTTVGEKAMPSETILSTEQTEFVDA